MHNIAQMNKSTLAVSFIKSSFTLWRTIVIFMLIEWTRTAL